MSDDMRSLSFAVGVTCAIFGSGWTLNQGQVAFRNHMGAECVEIVPGAKECKWLGKCFCRDSEGLSLRTYEEYDRGWVK